MKINRGLAVCDEMELKSPKAPRNVCITPTHLFLYDCQPLWIWYERFGDLFKKEPMSSFAHKLMEDGVTHEREIIQKYQITSVKNGKNSGILSSGIPTWEEYQLTDQGKAFIENLKQARSLE